MANSAATQIQRIASQTQVQLQKMVNSSNELQSKYNAAEAQKSREWQTEMSKTAHQMEVEDLKKAGLNPVLSSGGSGAQSYTTSSASISPESGAAAAAGVQESQIGALGNMEASRIAAAATKKAAAVSAAAMRSAAATSAAAQMYAASMNYKGRVYASDKAYQQAKYVADVQANVKRNVASTWSGLVDKLIRKGDMLGNKNLNLSAVKSMFKQPDNYFANKNGNITVNNFKLNNAGVKATNTFLKQNGLTQNAKNRKLVTQAFVFGQRSAWNRLVGTAKLLGNKKETRNVFAIRPGFR